MKPPGRSIMSAVFASAEFAGADFKPSAVSATLSWPRKNASSRSRAWKRSTGRRAELVDGLRHQVIVGDLGVAGRGGRQHAVLVTRVERFAHVRPPCGLAFGGPDVVVHRDGIGLALLLPA